MFEHNFATYRGAHTAPKSNPSFFYHPRKKRNRTTYYSYYAVVVVVIVADGEFSTRFGVQLRPRRSPCSVADLRGRHHAARVEEGQKRLGLRRLPIHAEPEGVINS